MRVSVEMMAAKSRLDDVRDVPEGICLTCEGRVSQILRLEFLAPADVSARNHELSSPASYDDLTAGRQVRYQPC